MIMTSSIFTLGWVKGAGERAIKSFVQGAIAGGGLSAAAPGSSDLPGLLDVPWSAALSAGLLMAVLSIATSVLQPDFTAGAPKDPPASVDDDGDAPDDVDEDLVEDELDDLADDPEAGLYDGAEPVGPDPLDYGDEPYEPEHAVEGDDATSPTTPTRV